MAKKAKEKVERKRVSLDELKRLVEVFQTATSIEEVASTLGWKIEKVRTQATRLRKRGVALKKFAKQSKLTETDIESLKGLCADCS